MKSSHAPAKSRSDTHHQEARNQLGLMGDKALALLGRSRKWLAAELHESPDRINSWFTRNPPDTANLVNLIEALNLDPAAACAATGRDLAAVTAIQNLHRAKATDPIIEHVRSRVGQLPIVEGQIPPILDVNTAGNPQATVDELEAHLRLLRQARSPSRQQQAELLRLEALVLHWLVSVRRETCLAADLPNASRDDIARLLEIGRRLRDPAIVARAHLADAHKFYVCANSVAAIREFKAAITDPRKAPVSPDETLLALRTMALAEAYLVARYRKLNRSARDTPQIQHKIDEVVRLSHEVKMRVDFGEFDTRHSAMTALEGAARACGLVGRGRLFEDLMDYAERVDRDLAASEIVYPLPRLQRIYARLSVYSARDTADDVSDFQALVARATSEYPRHRYPRHRAQIEAVADEYLNSNRSHR